MIFYKNYFISKILITNLSNHKLFNDNNIYDLSTVLFDNIDF